MECVAYEELGSCEICGVTVRKLKSRRTGMTVYHAQVEGPLVNGYFCLATEAHDNDGLPHTLEHLIFLGSEDYPYKGVLDQLANRCLARGTNAWTDVDNTVYTMTNAGSQGFLTLMPPYLEHILYPTLTDAGFTTEVHHINGEGEDAGVVYCEMQARENTAEERTLFQLLKAMYPGDCGYKSDTGGRLHNLRTSCSNERVKAYHKQYYRPDNLAVIITGQLKPDEVFAALAPLEEKILSKGPLPTMQRPWQSPVPPLLSSVCEVVPFPCDDERDGLVVMAWRGPRAMDRYAYSAIVSLSEYLYSTSVAPLQRGLIQIEEPYCSEMELLLQENAVVCVGLEFHGVPMEMLPRIKDKVLEILSAITDGKTPFDMNRMRSILVTQIRGLLNKMEEDPHAFVAFQTIGDFLFGQAAEDLATYVDQSVHYRKLLEEPESFWLELLKQYFITGPYVAMLGTPSIALAETMAQEEKERLAKQKESLGEAGLKLKGQELEEAIRQNELPAPVDIVNTFPIPGIDCIRFHPLVVHGNQDTTDAGLSQRLPVDQLPFFFQLHHMHSSLVKLTAALNTSVVPEKSRSYLPLYLELLFDSPVQRNGVLVPHDVRVREIADHTVNTSAVLGQKGNKFVCGTFPEIAFVTVKVEPEYYTKGVECLQEAMYGVQFTIERLTIVVNKLLNYVTKVKRMGDKAVKMVHSNMVFKGESVYNSCSAVTQEKFLEYLLICLKDPATSEKVIEDLKSVQSALVSPGNIRVFVAMNADTLPHQVPTEPWLQFVPCSYLEGSCSAQPPAVSLSMSLLQDLSCGRTTLAGLGSVESSYLIQSAPCIKTPDHSDLPSIMVLIEYLGALEGPLWRQIRGMGLSYGYRLECKPEDGLLYFMLLRSSHLVQAYEAARKIVDEFVKGQTPVDPGQLEAAISGTIFCIIDLEQSMNDLADQAILTSLKGLNITFSQSLLSAVAKVTAEDLVRVGSMYFVALFDPTIATSAMVCNTSKAEDIRLGFERFGHKVNVVYDLGEFTGL